MRKFILALMVVFFTCTGVTAWADGPPPPPGNPVSGGGTPVGAPVDSGVVILLALGIIYAATKLYHQWHEKREKPVE